MCGLDGLSQKSAVQRYIAGRRVYLAVMHLCNAGGAVHRGGTDTDLCGGDHGPGRICDHAAQSR